MQILLGIGHGVFTALENIENTAINNIFETNTVEDANILFLKMNAFGLFVFFL